MNRHARTTDPFQTLARLQGALASASRPREDGVERTSTRSFPPVNIFRRGDDFVAVVELPGIDRSDLDIEVLDNRIRIAGRRAITYDENYSVHRRERLSGQFDRTIDLSVQIDTEKVRAEFRDGLLAIHLPRADSDKPRSVPID